MISDDEEKPVKKSKGKIGSKQQAEQAKDTDSYQPISAKSQQVNKPTRRSNRKTPQLGGEVKGKIPPISDAEADEYACKNQNLKNKPLEKPVKSITTLKATRMKGKETRPAKSKNTKRTANCIILSDGDDEPVKKKRQINSRRLQVKDATQQKESPVFNIDIEDSVNMAQRRDDLDTGVAWRESPKEDFQPVSRDDITSSPLSKASRKSAKLVGSYDKKEENIKTPVVS